MMQPLDSNFTLFTRGYDKNKPYKLKNIQNNEKEHKTQTNVHEKEQLVQKNHIWDMIDI